MFSCCVGGGQVYQIVRRDLTVLAHGWLHPYRTSHPHPVHWCLSINTFANAPPSVVSSSSFIPTTPPPVSQTLQPLPLPTIRPLPEVPHARPAGFCIPPTLTSEHTLFHSGWDVDACIWPRPNKIRAPRGLSTCFFYIDVR